MEQTNPSFFSFLVYRMSKNDNLYRLEFHLAN